MSDEYLALLDDLLDVFGACPERIVCPGCGRVIRCDDMAGHVTDHRAPPCPLLGDPELS